MSKPRLLKQHETQRLKQIFDLEFEGSELPAPEQANIVGIVEDGEIQGFVVTEVLLRVGMIWIKPEHRNTARAASRILTMAKYVYNSIPEGSSVIAIAGDDKYAPLFKGLGMREVEGKVYRKDF